MPPTSVCYHLPNRERKRFPSRPVAAFPQLLKQRRFSDANFNIVACSSSVEPPDELHRHLMETGCLTPQMIQEKRRRLPERTYYVKEPSEVSPYARLSCPIFVNHIYVGSLSMSCHNTPLSEGLRDLFHTLSMRITPLIEHAWRKHTGADAPWYFFLEKMLSHKPVSNEYLTAQMEFLGVDENTEFKLVAFDADMAADPGKATQVIRAARNLSQGNVLCFPHRNVVLALLYTPPSDAALSHLKTFRCLHPIATTLDVACYVSEVFLGIENLDLAYRQTRIAFKLRKAIDNERSALERQDESGSIYFFGDAIAYYLVSPQARTRGSCGSASTTPSSRSCTRRTRRTAPAT